MWPLIEKRNKKRRHIKTKEHKIEERRAVERRKYLNWIELYLNDEDPDIS